QEEAPRVGRDDVVGFSPRPHPRAARSPGASGRQAQTQSLCFIDQTAAPIQRCSPSQSRLAQKVNPQNMWILFKRHSAQSLWLISIVAPRRIESERQAAAESDQEEPLRSASEPTGRHCHWLIGRPCRRENGE